MKEVTLKVVLIGLVLSLFAPLSASAADDDPFDGRLLPIELVMSHRQEIGLTRDQNKAIGKMVVAVQKSVAEKQWELQSGYFELIELLDAPVIDEERAVAVAHSTVGIENDIKTEQIRLLIKVRNLLDQKQIDILRERLRAGWQAPQN